jgi:secreted PhoX family phosphatase
VQRVPGKSTRQAADRVGATRMDRPEWGAVHPSTLEVYMTMTNNAQRGAPGRPGPDAANPRARSAKLRVARRTHVPAARIAPAALGLPEFQPKKGRR